MLQVAGKDGRQIVISLVIGYDQRRPCACSDSCRPASRVSPAAGNASRAQTPIRARISAIETLRPQLHHPRRSSIPAACHRTQDRHNDGHHARHLQQPEPEGQRALEQLPEGLCGRHQSGAMITSTRSSTATIDRFGVSACNTRARGFSSRGSTCRPPIASNMRLTEASRSSPRRGKLRQVHGCQPHRTHQADDGPLPRLAGVEFEIRQPIARVGHRAAAFPF